MIGHTAFIAIRTELGQKNHKSKQQVSEVRAHKVYILARKGSPQPIKLLLVGVDQGRGVDDGQVLAVGGGSAARPVERAVDEHLAVQNGKLEEGASDCQESRRARRRTCELKRAFDWGRAATTVCDLASLSPCGACARGCCPCTL